MYVILCFVYDLKVPLFYYKIFIIFLNMYRFVIRKHEFRLSRGGGEHDSAMLN